MTDEKARDAAFEEVKRTTNLLGAWDGAYQCIFDHKKMWESGYDIGYAAGAEAERKRIAVKLRKQHPIGIHGEDYGYIGAHGEDYNSVVQCDLCRFIDELEEKQDGK